LNYSFQVVHFKKSYASADFYLVEKILLKDNSEGISMKKFLISLLVLFTFTKGTPHITSYKAIRMFCGIENLDLWANGNPKALTIHNRYLTDYTLDIILGGEEVPEIEYAPTHRYGTITYATIIKTLAAVNRIRHNLETIETLEITTSMDLKKLPESIGRLRNLKKLVLKNNHLHSDEHYNWPSTFTNLTNLKELDVTDNSSLTKLPDGIENLRNLNIVKCDAENFSTLPVRWWPREIKLIQETFIENLRQRHIGLAHKNLLDANFSIYREIFWDWFVSRLDQDPLATRGRTYNETLLHHALYEGDIFLAKQLLSTRHSNIQQALNLQDSHGKTPLYSAIYYQQYSFLNWLQLEEQINRPSLEQQNRINEKLANSHLRNYSVVIVINNDVINSDSIDATEIDLISAIRDHKPIIVSMKLLYEALAHRFRIINQWLDYNILPQWYKLFVINIIKSEGSIEKTNLCLLLPDKDHNGPKYFGFRDDKLSLICNLNENVDNWARILYGEIVQLGDKYHAPISQDASALKILDSGFKWNICMIGHGVRKQAGVFNNSLVAGLQIETFKNFINYLESVQPNFLFYLTCFGGGINSLLAFKDANRHRKFDFPIAIGSVTESMAYNSLKNFEQFFNELQVRDVNADNDLWNALQYITDENTLSTNFPIIRHRREIAFKPLDINHPYVKKVSNDQRQQPLSFEPPVQIILWGKKVFHKTLTLRPPMPLIISTDPEDWVLHVINKVEAPDIEIINLINNFVPVVFGANKMFFIKELVCKENDIVTTFKNVLIHKTADTAHELYEHSCKSNVFLQRNLDGTFYLLSVINGILYNGNPHNHDLRQRIIDLIKNYAFHIPKSIPIANESPLVIAAYVSYCNCTRDQQATIENKLIRTIEEHLQQDDRFLDLEYMLKADFIYGDNFEAFVNILVSSGINIPGAEQLSDSYKLSQALNLLKRKLLDLAQKLQTAHRARALFPHAAWGY